MIDKYLNKNYSFFKIILLVLSLLFIGVIVTYWVNVPQLKLIYFSILLILFLFSKNTPFWLALFFIYISAPFGLFYGLDQVVLPLKGDAGLRLPFFVALISIIKYYFIKYKTNNYVNRYYNMYVIYFIILLFISIYYGLTVKSTFILLTGAITLTYFISIPLLLNSNEKLLQFNRIIFLFSIIFTVHILVDIVIGGKIISFLAPGGAYRWDISRYEREFVRMPGGILLCLYSLIMSLYYLASNSRAYKPAYLLVVAISSLIFIMNTGVRGWMIAASFVIILFLFLEYKSFLKYSVVIIILGLLLTIFIPERIVNNIQLSYERFMTLEAMILEGDETAGGTLSRLDIRAPRVMTHFHKNPVTGFGLSKITEEYGDDHVGNHNLLIHSGIIGFIIVYFTIIIICIWIIRTKIFLSKIFTPSRGLHIIVLGIIAAVIIHSTSRQIFNYPMPADAALLLSLFIAQVNSIIIDSKKYINKIR